MVFSKLLVSIDGTNLSSRFLPNELTVYDLKSGKLRHYFFNPPKGIRLTQEEKRTERYTRQHLGGRGMIPYDVPALEFYHAAQVISSLKGCRLYVMGNVSKTYISEMLPHTPVVDVQSLAALRYPATLPSTLCGEAHRNFRNCSMAKLIFVRDFLKNNPNLL